MPSRDTGSSYITTGTVETKLTLVPRAEGNISFVNNSAEPKKMKGLNQSLLDYTYDGTEETDNW